MITTMTTTTTKSESMNRLATGNTPALSSKVSRARFESAIKAFAGTRDELECRYVANGDDGNEEGALLAFRNIGTIEYERQEEKEEEDEVVDVDVEEEEEEDVAVLVARQSDKKSISRARVEVDIIYSASYEVPVLCLRAYDARSGSALNLDQTNRALVAKITSNAENDDDVFVQLLAPWDRQMKLPKCSIGGGWVCVHPCETSKALEILNETAQRGDDDDDVAFPFERWLRYSSSRLKINLF